MKRLISILSVLILTVLAAEAQNGLEGIRSKMEENRVSFSYSFSSEGKLPFGGGGRVVVQGKMYICEMEDGGKIWSDGKTRWTLDRDAREIYIENVASSPDILSNPEPYLASLRDLTVSKDGKSISAVYDNGKVSIGIKVNAIAELPPVTADAYFIPDLRKYSSSGWTVTDLR